MSIPTLDMQIAESDRDGAAKQLVAALEEPGFLYLKNVRGYQPDELLYYTKWFFFTPN
jgi:isopenicillin N synthase-like dioxygenase